MFCKCRSRYDTTISDACSALAKKWSTTSDDDLSCFSADDLKSLSSYQIKEVLAQLLEEVRKKTGTRNHIKCTALYIFESELQMFQ